MFPKAQNNRTTFWYVFEAIEGDGRWELILPRAYAQLFSLNEQSLLTNNSSGWHDTSGGKHQKVILNSLTDTDMNNIKYFISAYESTIILRPKPELLPTFNNELDFCIAVDMNANSPDELRAGKRTRIGELIYQIKYNNQRYFLDPIAHLMTPVILQLLKCDTQWVLSCVPCDKKKTFDLPSELVISLCKDAGIAELLSKVTPVELPKLKDAGKLRLKDATTTQQKLTILDKLYTIENVVLANNVSGRNICLIDDLYQSGSTMWSYAKFLKNNGARCVIGLACEKSLRDRSNK